MAPGGGFSLPQLAGVPTTQRMIADDRLAVTLAESLVKLDIALPDDWKKAERDPTSYIRITLERWIDAHSGAAIRRRFLLAASISTVPCEWAERDESQSNQLFLTVGPSEARDRKSTRLNSSHGYISYAVFCLKKKRGVRRAREAHRGSAQSGVAVMRRL